jgi:cytochrome P450
MLGAYHCVGKSLALVELRLTIAVLLKHYDVAFASCYDAEEMWRDMKDQVTAQPGRVLCTFKSRDVQLAYGSRASRDYVGR